MNVRAADQQSQGTTVKITREIPLWGILTVVGTLIAQGVSGYYSQVRLAENVERLSTEVRTLSASVSDLSKTQVGMEFQLAEVRRRVEALEKATEKR